MIKIYVFGNRDVSSDNVVITAANTLTNKFANITFIIHDPIQDFLPDEKDIIILDAAAGIQKVTIFHDLQKLQKTPALGLHDFDIAFNLKLLYKIKRINTVTIIAVPQTMKQQLCIKQLEKLIPKLFLKN